MLKSKPLLLGAGVAAAIWGATYLSRLNTLSNELESTTKVSIFNVSLTGLELRINVTLKNPSGGTVIVKHPFVKLMYQDKTIASSQVKDVNVTVTKFSEVNLDPITLDISFVALATTVPALFKEYRKTGKMAVTVKTVTTINDHIPYTKTDMITLAMPA